MTSGAQELSVPERLTSNHDLATFDPGVHALDEWLKRRALTVGSG